MFDATRRARWHSRSCTCTFHCVPSPYSQSAALYDRIYGDKAFADEAATIRRIVVEAHPTARTLLDVGCGTGGHLQHLRDSFTVEGLDLSTDMLDVARKKLGDVPLHTGDMRSFALARRFDAIICMFSAIGYVRSVAELEAAIANMARHLAPSGVLVVEPWFTPEQWGPSRIHGGLVVDTDELKVARLVVPSSRDRFSVTPMHHLVATKHGVEHFVETHELFLAERGELEHAFQAAGLGQVRHVPDVLVRGAWIGVAADDSGSSAGPRTPEQ